MSVTYHTAQLDNGVEMFYRESGSTNEETIVLLHGFPSSSRQFSELILLLDKRFHIIAPDLPAYGETKIPHDFDVSFKTLEDSVALLLKKLNVTTFSIYIFDYGAPTGLRLSLRTSEFTVKSIISQNGNAYEEGLQGFWDPVRIVWKLVDKPSLTAKESKQLQDTREELSKLFLTIDPYNMQYFDGEPDRSLINPENPKIDFELLKKYPNTKQNQLNLLTDYRKNVELYPAFQKFFRDTNIPILAIWGVNDFIFPREGQVAYKKDSKNVTLVELDAGHFAAVTHPGEIAQHIINFFEKYNI